MTEFPFHADQIEEYRFHGLIEGTFEKSPERLIHLNTSFGKIRLHPTKGAKRGRAFYAANRDLENHPNQVIYAYGFPRTNPKAVIHKMELACWRYPEAPMIDSPSVANRFQPGQIFLCGRVHQIHKDGRISVQVNLGAQQEG